MYQSKGITKKVDKLDLKRGEKVLLSIFHTWKNIKSSYNNNKFKILAPAWNDEYEIPDESYSISDIRDYFFKYISKKDEEHIDNPLVRLYVNKIKNGITFKIIMLSF